MPVINRKSPQVQPAKPWYYYRVFVSIKGHDEIYFTSEAARKFNLQPGKYLHFDNDGREWSFIQNDDPDGFPLVKGEGKNRPGCSVRIRHAGLCKMLRSSLGLEAGGTATQYSLLSTDKKLNGCPVVEIHTPKTYTQLMKRRQ